MVFDLRRSGLLAAAGILIAAAAACTGGSSVPSESQTGRIIAESHAAEPAPVPTSTEFTNGITPASEPRGIARGFLGTWFTQPGSNQIGHISATGVVREFSAPADGVNNLTVGPDGNLWFTGSTADVIWRMDQRGTITQFTVGNEAYGPFDITVGSDRNLWFTFRSPSTNAIGRITTAGVVTLFTTGLSPGDVAVHDLAQGSDGNIWFTEEFGNRIGRITPSGTITEFSAGISANAGLVDITEGPDGNLWFTENSLNQVGRITTSGSVTEFSQGISPNAAPGSITSAAGALWFTELNTHNVARMSTSGHVTEYPIQASLSSDIVPGASNTLWITDFGGNGIVEVTI